MINEEQAQNKATKLSSVEDLMATANMRTLIIRYSLPTIIGMLVNSLYNIIDRIWVGRIPGIGKAALTGIGICMPIMNTILGIAMLMGIGAAANISICLGRKDKKTAELILGNCLTLTIIASMILAVVGNIFAEPLLIMFGASDETLPYALQYIRIILAGSVFGTMSFSLNHPIRAAGNPMIFARTQMVGGIANSILDPIFIFGLGLGVAGAAIATVLSQMLITVLVFSHYFSDGTVLRLRKHCLKLRVEIVKTIFAIGISPCLMQIMASIIFIVANLSLKHYGDVTYGPGGGDTAIGAMTVINSVGMLFLMPIFGINQGSQPIIGYNYGAKNYDRVRSALKWSIVYAMTIAAFGFVMIELFAESFIYLFNNDDALLEIGAYGMRVILCMFIFVGFQIPSTNFFQAIGRAKVSIFLSLLRQTILLVPAYLILPIFFGLPGIWAAGPFSDFVAGVITFVFIQREMNRLKELHVNTQVLVGQN